MTYKQYMIVRLMIAALLSAFIASSIVRHDFFWPVVAIVVAMLLLLFLRRRMHEVIADERDYALGGLAARWAIQIFSLIAVLCMFLFFSLQDRDALFATVAFVLAYSTCGLMLLYALIFRLLRRYSHLHA
ncbi:MAG: DUF2178 domain-containing protein [Candidatus Peribacteraceae bacterium]